MAHDDKVPLTQSHAKNHSSIAINLPDNIEMGGKIDSIRVCAAPLWKTVLRYLSYVCTAFIMYLLNLWIPSLHVAMTFVDADIEKATWVVVHGADNNTEVVPLIQQSTFTKTIKVFTYRLFKYYYDDTTRAFQPCQFNIHQLTFNQINQEYKKGLDEISVNNNEIFYGKNLTNIPPVTVWQLLVKEILSPLYIFQVYSFIVWTMDDYTAYAVVILLFSAISITITLYDTMKTRNKLQKMSYYETPVKVFRRVHGQIVESTISSAELLPGDLIEIPERVLMPCDVVLLTGTCVMNEAMLTGESIPVVKNAIPSTNNFYNPQEDKQYTLYSGTECIQTRHHQGDAILGVVTLTGFTTVKGDLIRTMLFPKPTDFKFYSDSFKFIGIMAFLAVVGLLIDLSSWIRMMQEGVDLSNKVVIKALQIITVSVPPALPTCMQIGITIALARLSEKHIYCIAQSKINEAGRINVMCFDKTGTLTEEGLDLLGVRPVIFNKKDKEIGFYKLVHQIPRLTPKVVRTVKEIELTQYESGKDKKESFFSKAFMFPSEAMMEIMATCHSLTTVRGNMIGDPLDLKMFQATNWNLQDDPRKVHEILMLSICTPPDEVIGSPTKPRESFIHKDGIGIVQRYEFSSRMQRMSVVVKGLSDVGFRAHVKGSPEKIRELCRPETVPANFHTILRMYTEEGYRVLACGSKIVDMNARQIKAAKREDIENDLTFVGLIVMENRLKPITTRIIDQLQTANIKTVMVTGDNALTAISVARQCHIVGPQQRVYLGDVAEKKVDGKEVILWKDFEQSENRLNEVLEPDVEYGEDVGSTTFRRRYVKSYYDKSFDSESVGEGLNDEEKREFLSLHPSEAGTFNMMEHDEEKAALLRRKSSFGTSHFDILVHQDSCLAVTGRAFSLILKEANESDDPRHKLVFERMLQRCLIFARMHPDEKALMIKHLKANQRKTVGMCGDGANDVGALKTANAGVSLSEAEASIAAPFTSNIQDISCIATLLREGKSALAISFQTFKYMALYSIIQCTSVTILYYNVVDFTNEHYYYFDIFIILILSFTMGFSQTTDHLAEERPIGSLISFPVLVSVIGQTVIQIIFQLVTFALLTKQTWFTPWTLHFDERAPYYENTSLFCVSSFQYTIVSLAFIAGKPFRKPFYTNFWYSLALVCFLILNLLFLFNPFGWTSLYEADQLNMIYPMPEEWKDLLLVIIIFNCVATMAWETILVPIASNAWKERKRKMKSRKLVKN